jgi:hypothetical protein
MRRFAVQVANPASATPPDRHKGEWEPRTHEWVGEAVPG